MSTTSRIPSVGYAAQSSKAPLGPFKFDRREVGENDILIDIAYSGVCHSDIHQARDEWGGSQFPMVPGHEIVGKVVKVGSKVSQFKAGDLAGVGCMVGSCQKCKSCEQGLEQYCDSGMVGTYNSVDKNGEKTYGGYSNNIVVDQKFVLKISPKLDFKAVAPLLCAGVTTYSPLKHWKVGKGQKVGIVGLGGLGHMGVKFARAFGAHVVVFTTSESKKQDAIRLGAHEVILSKDPKEFAKHAGTFDFILNTVSAPMALEPYVQSLKLDGTMVLVGVPDKAPELHAINMIMKRRSIAGSLIGGIKETQEMLDFCADHNIVSDIEMINMSEINTAYERMIKGDVKYRFVIDAASIK